MLSRRLLDFSAKLLLFAAGAWLAQIAKVGPLVQGYPLLPWLYAHPLQMWLAILALALAAKIAALWRTRTERHRAIHRILDALVAEVMDTPQNFNDQNYRTTLFRFHRWSWKGWWASKGWSAWPWSGWLVGMVRSGSDSPKCATIFLASKPRQGAYSGHGVCGTAFLLGLSNVESLPILSAQSPSSDIAAYAAGSFISVAEVQQRIQTGRSLAAALHAERISVGKIRKWGVLVYDSIDPAPIIRADKESAHKLGLQSLSLVIEEFSQ